MKEILSKTNTQPKKRMQHIYDLCKGKNVCEGGDEMDTTLMTNPENTEDTEKKIVSIYVNHNIVTIIITIIISTMIIIITIIMYYK